MRGVLVLLFLFSLVSPGLEPAARADVLFLDLNNAPLEVAAAERAAAARGERLHVIPGVDKGLQEQLRATRIKNSEAKRKYEVACVKNGVTSSCSPAKKAYVETQKAHGENLKKLPKVDAKKLTSELKKLKDAGVDLTSVVISSHDGDREFWGQLADLDEDDIEKAFLANKPLGSNVRSVYLWGCYAATTDDFIKSWKKAFPPTVMMAGFAGQAPLGSRPVSGQLLEGMLVREGEFADTRDRKELQRLFKELDSVNKVNATLCVDRELIVTNRGVRTVEDDINACGKRNVEEEKHLKVYNCHLHADPGCEDVPKETDNTSPLRRAYDFLQETRHCEEVLEKKGGSRPVSQLTARRLLFDKQVRFNFEKHHKNELATMNGLLDELGFPEHLRYKELDKMSRKDYLDTLKGIEREWLARTNAIKDDEGFVLDAKVVAVGKYINEIQKLEKGSCVPLGWVEEGEVLRDSKCGIKQGMQVAIKQAEREVGQIIAERGGDPSAAVVNRVQVNRAPVDRLPSDRVEDEESLSGGAVARPAVRPAASQPATGVARPVQATQPRAVARPRVAPQQQAPREARGVERPFEFIREKVNQIFQPAPRPVQQRPVQQPPYQGAPARYPYQYSQPRYQSPEQQPPVPPQPRYNQAPIINTDRTND